MRLGHVLNATRVVCALWVRHALGTRGHGALRTRLLRRVRYDGGALRVHCTERVCCGANEGGCAVGACDAKGLWR
jgi:hypothetical protein